MWCISIQQLSEALLAPHFHSLLRAVVYAIDNPIGSLSTTFEAIQVRSAVTYSHAQFRALFSSTMDYMRFWLNNSCDIMGFRFGCAIVLTFTLYVSLLLWQAVVKLASLLNENMRDLSHIWAPPIYRRLLSFDKRERDMSERCLLKIRSTIIPPPLNLSKVLTPQCFRLFCWTLSSGPGG